MLPVLANVKSSSVESLFGPLGELLNAMVNFVWWSIWVKGFGCCLALVLFVVVFALVCGAVSGLVGRRSQ